MKGIKVIRKAYLTLLETMIAISLLSVVLVIVFSFFKELSVIAQAGDQIQKSSFQMRYVETRLQYIFERIVNEKDKDTRTFYFYTDPPKKGFSPYTSLIFTFDNGVRADPSFSGDILARLYVDNDEKLSLAMWPLKDPDVHEHMQQEVLLDLVKSIEFKFYSPPERSEKTNSIMPAQTAATPLQPEKPSTDEGGKPLEKKTEPDKDKWYENEWLKSHNQIPVIIEIELKVETEPDALKKNENSTNKTIETYVYRFVMPSSKNYIFYPKE